LDKIKLKIELNILFLTWFSSTLKLHFRVKAMGWQSIVPFGMVSKTPKSQKYNYEDLITLLNDCTVALKNKKKFEINFFYNIKIISWPHD